MAIALIDDDGSTLSHAELAARAAGWAAYLEREHGVRAGDKVAVLAYGAAEVFVVMAACARLGAVFVPLSWRLAPAEIAEIVRDCRPVVVICDEEHAGVWLEARMVRLDGKGNGNGNGNGFGDQVLYTSGTSGKPKGIRLPRRQIEFNAQVTARLCALGPGDRVLGLLPLFHTGGLHALATPVLSAGGAVSVMRRFDAATAIARIERDGITSLIAVPTVFEQLLDAGLGRERAPALRVLLVGGAPVAPALLARYRSRGLDLRQGYGLTEVGPNCFTFGRDGTVGRPVPGTAARLVDERGADVAPGEIGELLLSGPHVATGEAWFATGDLARADADGRYRIVGRKKEMFISGGENVYPAEVELVLATHPAIAEVAVVGVADPRWGEVGLAAVVARGPVEPAALAAWARDRIAAYKVPRHWRLVGELPRTASGKIAKSAICRMLGADGRGPHQAAGAPGARDPAAARASRRWP
jgi:fatty-acyl-CoA synthase